MKKITTALGIVASLALLANAENIDGTLAVDSANSFTNNQVTDDSKLSANLDSNLNSSTAKDSVEASTIPATTGNVGGYSFLEGPFVGVEGSAILGSEAKTENGSLDSSTGMSWGLRFGAQNIEWRTMAIIEKYGGDDTLNNYVRGLLQVDYYFLGMDNLVIDTYAIRPYAGVNAGIISMDIPDSNDPNAENRKALTYGAQIGATMNVTQNIDLDVGYRYNLATSDYIDHTHGIAVGLHYKY